MRIRNTTLLINESVWHITITRHNRHMPDIGLCQLWFRLPTFGFPSIIMHFLDTCQWSQIFKIEISCRMFQNTWLLMANLSIGCYKSRSENKDLHHESLHSWSFLIKIIAFCWCSGDCLKWLPAEWSQLPGKSSAVLISLPWKHVAWLLWEEPVSGLERAHASVPLGIRGSFVSVQLFLWGKRYRVQVHRALCGFKQVEPKQHNSLYLAYCWGCSWARKISPAPPYDFMPGWGTHSPHY